MDVGFKDILTGDHAFYVQPQYATETQEALRSGERVPTVYTVETESKSVRIVRQALSCIIFPIGLCQLLHALIGRIIIPASMAISQIRGERSRIEVLEGDPWKYRRITVEVDGLFVDGMIMGKAETLGNGRWMLASLGNGQCYEEQVNAESTIHALAEETKSNVLLFNYSGVGASSGAPTKEAMKKAYQAMLRFLEDEQQGIGAKEIIGYGHSLGGGAQSLGLEQHTFRDGVRYVFVKSKTFSSVSAAVSGKLRSTSTLLAKLASMLVIIFGWEINSAASSQRLQAHEIVVQRVKAAVNLGAMQGADMKNDGVISAAASLGRALLENPEAWQGEKTFIGVRTKHNQSLEDDELGALSKAIEEAFDPVMHYEEPSSDDTP